MRYFIFLSLLVSLSLISCEKETTDILIRIENKSGYKMESILVNSFGEEYRYGDLGSGAISDYQIIDQAYSYSYIEVTIDGSLYVLQPVDFVGETELTGGEYTYILNADSSTDKFGRLSFEFRVD